MRTDRGTGTAAVAVLLLMGLGACTAGTPVPDPSPPGETTSLASPVPEPSPTSLGAVSRVWATERSTMSWPAEMTTDRDGNVWVREMGAMTVTKFAPDGHRLLSTGGMGTINGQFDFHGHVHMFEGGIAASPAGEVVVADGTRRLQRFNLQGRFLGMWQPPRTRHKVAVTALDFSRSGELYAVRGHVVEVYRDGRLVRSWGDKGPRAARLEDPDALVVDAAEHVYVADEATGRVRKFDRDGKLLASWGRHGDGKGEFGTDGTFIDMAVDSHAVYVVDKRHQRVQRFSPTGRFLAMWDTAGQDLGSFLPAGVTLDPDGSVYVAENSLGRLVKFRMT